MSQGGKAKVVVEGKKKGKKKEVEGGKKEKKVRFVKTLKVAAKAGDQKAQQRLAAYRSNKAKKFAERRPAFLLRQQQRIFEWAKSQKAKVLAHRKYAFQVRKINRKRKVSGLPLLPLPTLKISHRPGQHSKKKRTGEKKKPEQRTPEEKKKYEARKKHIQANLEAKRRIKEKKEISRLRKLGVLPTPHRERVTRIEKKNGKVNIIRRRTGYFGNKPYDPTHSVLFKPNTAIDGLLKKRKLILNKYHLRLSKRGRLPSSKPRLVINFPKEGDYEKKRKLEETRRATVRAAKRAKLAAKQGKPVKKVEKKAGKKEEKKEEVKVYAAKRPILPFFDVDSPHANNRTRHPRVHTHKVVHPLRKSITPGTVLIRLKPPYLGRRVVFLKQLESGRLLVAGPHKVNGVPLHRVHQKFVIATTSRVTVKPSWFAHLREKEIFVKNRRRSVAHKKSESKFFNAKKANKKQARKKVLNAKILTAVSKYVDKKVTKSISRRPLMVAYMRNRFTLGPKVYPHLLKF